jgi:predicted dehydrogenase
MLRKERPAIVSVCPRWVDCHHDMVIAACEHGASVFLEKPLARTLAEADAMVRASEMSHVKVAVAHQTRYSPKLPVVKRLLQEGRIGDVLEIRGRGKEDSRGGGEDLWVLGTHVFDLMRGLAGDAEWCFARVTQSGRPVARADVREGNEGLGPLAGDGVDAMFRLGGAMAYFASHKGRAGNPSRYGMAIHGSKGILEVGFGYLPSVKLLADPSWSPGRTGTAWADVSSQGIGEPEPLQDLGLHGGNLLIVRDLIRSVEEDRQPLGSIHEARAATEMIAAVFESHRQGRAVKLPLENRENPLRSL